MYKEKDVRVCVEPKGELEGCKEAYANTTYINDIYNCNNCSMNYLSYYSLFFNRKICQNIYQDIIKRKELTNNAFDEIESVLAKNGRCENNRLFTPDGINCYLCNNTFYSNVKVYNPIEVQEIKDIIKLTLLLKKKAHPTIISCCKDIDVETQDFFHKKD